MKRIAILTTFIGVMIALGMFFILNSQITTANQNMGCRSVEAIFARGSGQPLNDREAVDFFDKVRSRLPLNTLSFGQYELGTSPQNNHQYPAVKIPGSYGKTLLGAWTSAGTSYSYGASVNEGALELGNYLINIHQQCPDSLVVLGGYSQGAHVIGQSLRSLPKIIRDKISFAALFGDPKLSLPEGKGLIPTACLEKQFSPWRREVSNCNISSGVLGAREPYLPVDMEHKTGLWCLNEDVICGSWENISFRNSHGNYRTVNGPIDQAAHEIALSLKHKLSTSIYINTLPRPNQLPINGFNLMFVFDNSLNTANGFYTQFVRPKVNELLSRVDTTRLDNRIGYASYYGGNDPFLHFFLPAKSNTGFEINTQLDTLEHFPSEHDMSQDLIDTLEWLRDSSQIQWHPFADRLIIVFTNTPFNVPLSSAKLQQNSAHTTTFQTTSQAPSTVIYPMVPNDIISSFSNLNLNNTQVILPSEQTIGTLLTSHLTNPQLIARLTNTDYMALPNTELRFNANDSLVHDDTIATYEWDFDSNGTIDKITTDPIVFHKYPRASSNTMTVRISTASGITDTATANVRIVDPSSLTPTPKKPINLKVEETSDTNVKLTWQPGDNLADTWIVSINDMPLGRVAKNQLFINISDILPNQVNIFSVQALTSDFTTGEKAFVSLSDKLSPTKPESLSAEIIDTASTAPVPSQKATNLFEVTGTTLNLPAAPMHSHSFATSTQSSLIYCIIGGMLLSVALFVVTWVWYKKSRKSKIR